MTAPLPVVSSSPAPSREHSPRRVDSGAILATLCWSVAALGLLSSYWLGALALQAGACLIGLLGATVAVLLLATQRD